MKIVKGFPPNIEDIRKKFTLRSGVIFSYGEKIYNPDNIVISPELMTHEKTHSRQQAGNPEAWWDKYVKDDSFRLKQELEAYGNQYKSFKSKNRTAAFMYGRGLAEDLSSDLYGNIVDFSDAYAGIVGI